MRVIVGLGNPGAEYADTRHNAGFILADALVADWRLPPFRRGRRVRVTDGLVGGQRVVVLKPQTFMNDSGAALAPALAQPDFAVGDLLILVDDSALPLGTFRLRARGSSGGHHGLASIEAVLGTRRYARLRIGIGPTPEGVDDLADFVLARFTLDEARESKALLPRMREAVECWLADGIDRAMNRFNRTRRPE